MTARMSQLARDLLRDGGRYAEDRFRICAGLLHTGQAYDELARAREIAAALEEEHHDLLRRLRQLADAWPKHSAERLMLEAAIAPPAEPADDEPADLGHTFRIRIRERGAFGHVDGRPAQDAGYWTELPAEVDVRGWSLCEALARAAALPLGVWFGEPLPDPEPLFDLHSERGESVDGGSR